MQSPMQMNPKTAVLGMTATVGASLLSMAMFPGTARSVRVWLGAASGLVFGEYTVTADELSASLGQEVAAIGQGTQLSGGLIGKLERCSVEYVDKEGEADGCPSTVVVKCSHAGWASRAASIFYGMTREVYFYRDHLPEHPELASMAPTAYAVKASPWTGKFLIAMEDVTGEQGVLASQVVRRPITPGPEDGAIPMYDAMMAAGVTQTDVLIAAAKALARFHAPNWQSEQAIAPAYMRGSGWVKSQGRGDWMAVVAQATAPWAAAREQIVAWGAYPSLVAAMDTAVAETNWAAFRAAVSERLGGVRPFTVVHGDWHCSNMFVSIDDDGEIGFKVVDWAVFGFGAPLADLTQLMISDVAPELRRKCEKDVVQAYWEALVAAGVDGAAFTLDDAWNEYCAGWGVSRWLWLIGVLASLGLPEAMLKYFLDQVEAFLVDHKAENEGVVHILTGV